MRWPMAAVVTALVPAVAGCSLIYNPSNLPNPQGSSGDGGAGLDAALPVADANDSMLAVTDISPSTIHEGQGDGGSFPALLVIHGQNIVNSNLKVELTPPSGTTVKLDPVTDAMASHDADYLAFTVVAHVDPALAAGTTVMLDVKVTQDVSAQYGGGTVTRPGPTDPPLHVMLQGLAELTVASPELDASTNKLTLPASPQTYSMVDLITMVPATPAITFAVGGAAYAAIDSESSLAIGDVNAAASGQTAGPGGQPGGTSDGACTTPGGGGLHGTDAAALAGGGGGGGGAGGATTGVSGGAGAGGLGVAGAGGTRGVEAGTDQMVSLAQNSACAGGRGGIGGLLSTNKPGESGAGGGSVVLTAGGDLRVSSITVRGSAGANGATGVELAGAGGGGGGGAGGNVLLQTENGALSVTKTVDITGGGGGTPNGGSGASGRLRWDAPDGTAPTPQARRGFSLARLTSRVFVHPAPELTVVGTSGDLFSFRVIDSAGAAHLGDQATFNNGTATIAPNLFPGYNQVCITLANGANSVEGDHCFGVAFLP